jgi:hypothetical protein
MTGTQFINANVLPARTPTHSKASENEASESRAETELLATINVNRNSPKLRLFAADCAERVIRFHEALSDSTLPQESIAFARAVAAGGADPQGMTPLWLAYPITNGRWAAFASAAQEAARATLWEDLNMAAWWTAKHAAEAEGLYASHVSFWRDAGFIGAACDVAKAHAERGERAAQLVILKGYFPDDRRSGSRIATD